MKTLKDQNKNLELFPEKSELFSDKEDQIQDGVQIQDKEGVLIREEDEVGDKEDERSVFSPLNI